MRKEYKNIILNEKNTMIDEEKGDKRGQKFTVQALLNLYLILTTVLQGMCSPHFTEKETEPWRA